MSSPSNEPAKVSDAKARQRDLMGAALRRTSSDPAASTPRPVAPRVEPIRTTIDLAPDLHQRLKVWAATDSVKLSEVFRALVHQLLEDPALADDVRRLIRESKSR
ncbi:MAG: hypothetical protein ACRDTJ_29595 [Pseudonocardiaceae bacterium]